MQRLIISICLFTTISILAQEVRSESFIDFFNRTNSIRHTLKAGETISGVLENKGYRDIYKKGGTTDQTFWKNGIRKDQARKLPIGLEFALPYDADIARSLRIESIKKPNNNKERKIASLEKVNSKKNYQLEKVFFLDLGYGVRYFSIKQSGVLGSANVSVTTPNYLALKTGIRRNDITYSAEFGLGKFEMKSNSKESSEQLMHYSFGLGYKNVFLGAGINQLPLFKNNSGSVEMVKLNTTNIKIGYSSIIKLNTQREASIRWEISGGIPLSGSSNNNDAKVSGYEAQVKISFEREISKNQRRQISYFFRQDIQYSDLDINTDWGTSKGSLDYTGINSSFQVGLKFEF